MGRIRQALATTARAAARIPIPSAVTTHALREARRPLPPGQVQKRHAIDVEMLGRTRCVWLDRHHAEAGLIVHLSGGAYVSGPFASDWMWLSRQVDRADCAGLVIDYRTAPDHEHPIAIDDVLSALRVLADQGLLGQGPWVLTGQHAGGGLALAVAQRLREDPAVPAPAAIVAIGPWLDLELSNAGFSESGAAEQFHEQRMMLAAARAYAGRTPLSDPQLSPMNGELAGLPPIHLSVGSRDLVAADVRVARLQLEEQDVPVEFRELNGRLAMRPWLRGGEDMERLQREQADFIAAALSPRG